MKLIDLTYQGKALTSAADVEAITSYLAQQNPFSEDTLLLATNRPAVVIGRLQDAYTEVNLTALRDAGVELIRRSSGGGAVYMDEGSFVYTFNIVEAASMGFRLNFAHYAQPLIQTLTDLGLPNVALTGRNDVTIAERKVSGMAGFQVGQRFGVGGTIIFKANPTMASQLLTPLRSKFESKGFHSVASRITDIKSLLPATQQDLSADDFRQRFLAQVFHVKLGDPIPTISFTDEQWTQIMAIKAERYGNDLWNYGRQPHFSNYVRHHYDQGTVAINFEVDQNRLTRAMIFGDFFTEVADLSAAEEQLVGTKMTFNDLSQTFDTTAIKQVFSWMSGDQFAHLMLAKN